MSNIAFSEISKDVKVVIWDLDETFWTGTLSEGGISPIPDTINMVNTLVDRGIMCSICSKNDLSQTKAQLESLEIWDKFVMPHIAWSPKGQAVKSILKRMGLREENAVFLDDNHLNIEEVKFFCPDIACVNVALLREGELKGIIDLPQLKGKNDKSHSRLQQYKILEQKEADQQHGSLSNEDFLRQSEIKIRIINDLDGQMDRILELINRTNQLNFTKVRVHNEEEIRVFKEYLRVPGVHAGLVHVQDRYGDYGIVGFFCIRKRFNTTEVQHFAFSCRTLNMGIEQWVWNYLGQPAFIAVAPVANSLDVPASVDWITEVDSIQDTNSNSSFSHLSLVGGCDLQQISFYCSTRRDEFVNKPDDQGLIVRYDDVGFFLNPRDLSLKNNWVMNTIAGYTLEDMQAADASFGQADVIILSLYHAFANENVFTFSGHGQDDRYLITVPPKRLGGLIRDPKTVLRMLRLIRHLKLDTQQKLLLIRKSFEHAYQAKRENSRVFILGVSSVFGDKAEKTKNTRLAFNDMCAEFCAQYSDAEFIDIDAVVPKDEFFDSDHYTRTGYFKIASYINSFSHPVLEDAL